MRGSEPTTASERVRRRIARIDEIALARALDERGHARIPRLLDARACGALARLWSDEALFRSAVDMERHRFGRGAYRYFAEPLPPLVATLRATLYPLLARVANAWQAELESDERFPPALEAFRARCAAAGQRQPTPLLLRYGTDGFNCLHRDRYGEVAFPLQVTVLLSRPASAPRAGDGDFEGGEFLLAEQLFRQQTRAEAIALARGEAIVFPNDVRPVRGARGVARAAVRHGVSRIHRGERFALGLIFHDAR